MSNVFYVPRSALAIYAHPDDIEFSCAGLLARWAKAGTEITYVLCTSGEVGIADPGMTKAVAAEIREEETRQAAAIAGAREVVFLREPDGLLEASLLLRKKLVREIRRFRPEVVLCSDPTVLWGRENYINHPDHRAAGIAALDAVFPAAGQPNLFEELETEGLRAHKTRKVYVSGWSQTETYVSIDETIETKIAALRAHKSQMKDWDPADRIHQWASEVAKGKEMQYAEAFRVVTLVEDETWEKTQGEVRPNSD
ncbi:MAG: PIG-L family deacetylase [Anaerolineaceae bacterium]|nr:PIG-L family deacetylase [Anaerolineaceae bacterium]